MATIIQMPIGSDKDFLLQGTTDGSTAITSFLNSDTLASRLWAGGRTATLATPAVAWDDATSAKFLLQLAAADTTSLDSGTYRLQVVLTRSSRSLVIFDGSLQLTESPGAVAAPAVYTTYAQMIKYAPWLETLQDARDSEGFVTQRGLARDWLDNLVLAKYRGGSGSLTYPLVNTFGGITTGAKNKWLKDQLAANYLMVTPDVIEAVSKYAIAIVLKTQLPAQGDDTWRRVAGDFMAEARSKISTIVAELDTNNDGYADIVVHLGTSNTLFG